MKDDEVARMILEGLAYQMSALPDQVWQDAFRGGCSPAIVNGLRDAREAFLKHFTENDTKMLADHVDADIREGLTELDKRGGA